MKHPRFDDVALPVGGAGALSDYHPRSDSSSPRRYHVAKRGFDVALALALFPVFLGACVALVLLNPFYNPGSLLYVQKRMGRRTRAFRAVKFRTMSDSTGVERTAHDPVEVNRITPLGRILRKTRIDEIPQIINVLRGEMSFIGPRPDYYDHALEYLDTVPGYRARHTVKPGISGYAQTEVGYADNLDAVAQKVAADLYYIRNRRLRLEAWIVWRTIQTVFGFKGI